MCEKSVDKILSRKVDCYDYLETCMLLDGLSCQMRRWQTAPVLHHLHQPSKFSWIPLAFTHPFQRENLHASFFSADESTSWETPALYHPYLGIYPG